MDNPEVTAMPRRMDVHNHDGPSIHPLRHWVLAENTIQGKSGQQEDSTITIHVPDDLCTPSRENSW